MSDLFKPPPPPKPVATIGPGARLRTCWACNAIDKKDCPKCRGTGKVIE